jgi:hypothetical protein
MKRLLIALLLLALAGGAGVWLLRVREPRNAPITLSDGTVLVFRGATYGTVHEYHGGGWRGRMAGWLPERMAKRIRQGGSIVTTYQPSLTVWFERTRLSSQTAPVAIELVLGTGTSFSWAEKTHGLSSGLPGGATIEGVGWTTFPRRGRTITLRLYDGGVNRPDRRQAGEFTFANPAITNPPGWQPEPLPATRRVEDFDVTLKEFITGVDRSHGGALRPAARPTESGVHARLGISRSGQDVSDWHPSSAELSDATGNQVRSTRWTGLQKAPGDYSLNFTPSLWTDERAWKLRLELSRWTNFPPDEVWTVRGVPVGATDLKTNPAFRTNLQGAVLQLEGAPERATRPGQHEATLTVNVSPHRRDYRLTLVTVFDEQGREAKSWGPSLAGASHTFYLHFATNAHRLDVTLALHRSRYVEFLVAPKRLAAGTNGLSAD